MWCCKMREEQLFKGNYWKLLGIVAVDGLTEGKIINKTPQLTAEHQSWPCYYIRWILPWVSSVLSIMPKGPKVKISQHHHNLSGANAKVTTLTYQLHNVLGERYGQFTGFQQ